MSVTLIIIIVTSLVSILCFTGTLPFDSLKFSAWDVWHRKRWYQMLSYGLVHGGWGHLLFNMLTLYFFGDVVEKYFQAAFLVKYKDDPHYSAVGASGAVSAILFASILFEPKMGIYMYFIPIPIPGYIFAPLYLLYCWWAAKRNMDNIGHSAHFWGAVYGLVFPLICNPQIFHHFLSQLQA